LISRYHSERNEVLKNIILAQKVGKLEKPQLPRFQVPFLPKP